MKELDFLIQRKWLRSYPSKEKAKRALRGRIIVSKLLVITKEKTKNIGSKLVKKVKKRLIPNLKKSGVTSISVKS